jgi:hypothetical protein
MHESRRLSPPDGLTDWSDMGYSGLVMLPPILLAAPRRFASTPYRPQRTGGALTLVWTSRKPALQFHD